MHHVISYDTIISFFLFFFFLVRNLSIVEEFIIEKIINTYKYKVYYTIMFKPCARVN